MPRFIKDHHLQHVVLIHSKFRGFVGRHISDLSSLCVLYLLCNLKQENMHCKICVHSALMLLAFLKSSVTTNCEVDIYLPAASRGTSGC